MVGYRGAKISHLETEQMAIRALGRLIPSKVQVYCKEGTKRLLNKYGILIIRVGSYTDETFAMLRQSKKETLSLQSDHEAFHLYMGIKSVAKLEGDIAEVGVFKGGSANIICKAKGSKSLHLFDTFEGLPDVEEVDRHHFQAGAKCFQAGQFRSSLSSVQDLLGGYPDVHFYQGVFPATATGIVGKTFSFVHLDVDLYSSTLECLHFFYPRMQSGGIIFSHDHPRAEGVKRAFDEFFRDKREPVVQLLDNQCLTTKI